MQADHIEGNLAGKFSTKILGEDFTEESVVGKIYCELCLF